MKIYLLRTLTLFLCGLITRNAGRFSPAKIDGAMIELGFGKVYIFSVRKSK